MALELPGRLRDILGADAKTRVVVVERGPQPGARYSEELRNVIIEASAELGVEWLVNTEVESVDATGITLKDGQTSASQTVIWTVGVQANDLTGQIDAPRDRQGRLRVKMFSFRWWVTMTFMPLAMWRTPQPMTKAIMR